MEAVGSGILVALVVHDSHGFPWDGCAGGLRHVAAPKRYSRNPKTVKG